MKPQDHRGKKFAWITPAGMVAKEHHLKLTDVLPKKKRLSFPFSFTVSIIFMTLNVALALFISSIFISIKNHGHINLETLNNFTTTPSLLTFTTGIILGSLFTSITYRRQYWKSKPLAIESLLTLGYCPSCSYNISALTPDPTDNCTLCPECGCAWRVDNIDSSLHKGIS